MLAGYSSCFDINVSVCPPAIYIYNLIVNCAIPYLTLVSYNSGLIYNRIAAPRKCKGC